MLIKWSIQPSQQIAQVNNTTTVHRPEGVVEVIKLDSVGNVESVTTTVNGENRTTAYKYNG